MTYDEALGRLKSNYDAILSNPEKSFPPDLAEVSGYVESVRERYNAYVEDLWTVLERTSVVERLPVYAGPANRGEIQAELIPLGFGDKMEAIVLVNVGLTSFVYQCGKVLIASCRPAHSEDYLDGSAAFERLTEINDAAYSGDPRRAAQKRDSMLVSSCAGLLADGYTRFAISHEIAHLLYDESEACGADLGALDLTADQFIEARVDEIAFSTMIERYKSNGPYSERQKRNAILELVSPIIAFDLLQLRRVHHFCVKNGGAKLIDHPPEDRRSHMFVCDLKEADAWSEVERVCNPIRHLIRNALFQYIGNSVVSAVNESLIREAGPK